jgi:hypothetical protein
LINAIAFEVLYSWVGGPFELHFLVTADLALEITIKWDKRGTTWWAGSSRDKTALPLARCFPYRFLVDFSPCHHPIVHAVHVPNIR